MISVARARQTVLAAAQPLPPVALPLAKAWGLVLAGPLRSRVAYPAFDNSAMDGYAVRSRDLLGASERMPLRLPIKGVRLAQAGRVGVLRAGTCQGVMTGAPIPKGADAVVPREAVRVEGQVAVFRQPADKGDHIRRKGEDLRPGGLLLPAGTCLSARDLALAAGGGHGSLRCRPRPRVALLVSGSELVAPGARLRPGQIHDSNGVMLAAALEAAGSPPCLHLRLSDRAASFRAGLQKALSMADVVLVSGGVSVGDRDLTKPMLAEAGVRSVFWKVAQKPGKPLFFGKLGRQLIFGLPGNPAAAMVCFAHYVIPALRKLAALPPAAAREAVAGAALCNDGDRMLFLRCRLSSGAGGRPLVLPLPRQGSHALSSLAQGQVLLPLAPGVRVRAGQAVPVLSW